MARADLFTTKTGKEIIQELDAIAATEGPRSAVFSDWLDVCLCCMAGETMEDLYLRAIKKYADSPRKEQHINRLVKGWNLLLNADEPDVLGDIHQGGITWGEHGQFFTPWTVCEMMARMTGLDSPGAGRTIHDPCCGSGRMLLAAAKVSGPLAEAREFSGVDVDPRCAKMAAINLALAGLQGWIVQGNSLSLELRTGYLVQPFRGENFPGFIREVDPLSLMPREKANPGKGPAELPPVTQGGKVLLHVAKQAMKRMAAQASLFAEPEEDRPS